MGRAAMGRGVPEKQKRRFYEQAWWRVVYKMLLIPHAQKSWNIMGSFLKNMKSLREEPPKAKGSRSSSEMREPSGVELWNWDFVP